MKSASSKLQDQAIADAVRRTRYAKSVARKVLSFLNVDLYPEIVVRLERILATQRVRGFKRSLRSTQRLRDLLKYIEEKTKTSMTAARKLLEVEMKDFAFVEAVHMRASIAGVLPVQLSVVKPATSLLNSAVVSRPFEGKLLKEHFTTLDRSLQASIKRSVNTGLKDGHSIDQIVRSVRRSSNTSRRHVQSIAHSAVHHVSAHAREETYVANKTVVSKVRILATLDTDTTDTCKAYDGQVFPIGEGPRPLFHIRCRTTTAPVMKSFAELGLDLNEVPEGTRASLDGGVPSKVTYEQWLRGQSVKRQNEALGIQKAKMFREGNLSISKFVDSTNQPISLKQLKKSYNEDGSKKKAAK